MPEELEVAEGPGCNVSCITCDIQDCAALNRNRIRNVSGNLDTLTGGQPIPRFPSQEKQHGWQ